jgi:hypothetical protein
MKNPTTLVIAVAPNAPLVLDREMQNAAPQRSHRMPAEGGCAPRGETSDELRP